MIEEGFVSDDAGTGFVHTAPSHGADDYEAFARRGWTDRLTHNVGEESEFLAHVPIFAGDRVFDSRGREGHANRHVIDQLVEAGAMFARGRLNHTYPHSWRSKAPVICSGHTPQWFASIDREVGGNDKFGKSIRERALNSIDRLVTWTPQSGRNRLHSMIETRPDWVLSRQRVWGVPLTCFTKKGGNPSDDDFVLRDERRQCAHRAGLPRRGCRCLVSRGRFRAIPRAGPRPQRGGNRCSTSSMSGSIRAQPTPSRFGTAMTVTRDGIADLYLEGTDQHRGWFQSSMLQACGTKGRAPYPRRSDPWLHARRKRHENVEVAREHRGARECRSPVRR